jgi:hypothetical protein
MIATRRSGNNESSPLRFKAKTGGSWCGSLEKLLHVFGSNFSAHSVNA